MISSIGLEVRDKITSAILITPNSQILNQSNQLVSAKSLNINPQFKITTKN